MAHIHMVTVTVTADSYDSTHVHLCCMPRDGKKKDMQVVIQTGPFQYYAMATWKMNRQTSNTSIQIISHVYYEA